MQINSEEKTERMLSPRERDREREREREGASRESGRRDRSVKWRAVGDTDIGGSRENQDDMFIFERQELGICVIGVLDGHGRDVGQTASLTGRKFFLNYFDKNCQSLLTDAYNCLVEGINQAHAAVKASFIDVLQSKGWEVQVTGEDYLVKRKNSSSPWACVHGGTSCSIIALVGTMLYIANVGDSSGILSTSHNVLHPSMITHLGDSALNHKRQIPSIRNPTDELVNTLVLTAEHSPESPEEFLRMREFRPRDGDPTQPSLLVVYDASTHDKSRCSPVFSLDRSGKPVVTNRGSYYKNVRKEWASLVAAPSYARFQDALAFTRSIGDFHLHVYGVTHLPEVQSLDLTQVIDSLHTVHAYDDPLLPPTIAIVLASDGIWDNWDYKDVTSYLMNPELRKHSQKRSTSEEKSGDDRDDDIHIGHTKFLSKSLIRTNAEYASRNFGNQADNATGIVLLIHPNDHPTNERDNRK